MDDYPATPASTPGAVVPVLMAGGTGSRLWPLSRESHPKQFLALNGAHSLLQNTLHRACAISGVTSPVVIGAEAQRFLIAEQVREAGIESAALLYEPEARDTAPAAAVAAHHVAGTFGGNAIVFLMAADHVIADVETFCGAVHRAIALADKGHVVTFGIRPNAPETGYGYLRTQPGGSDEQGHRVEAFVEKPDLARATRFIEQGGHWWNSGMFVFRADRFLALLDQLEPALGRSAFAALDLARRLPDGLVLDPKSFAACRKVSIDYAIMEKLDDLMLVPLDAGWDDVGSWSHLATLPASDTSENRMHGDVLLHDSSGNLVHAESRLVAMIGMQDHVVVETADAVLVTPRSRVQDVKHLVQRMQAQGRSETKAHRRVARPWGSYESIADGSRFQVKRIVVKPGQKLSLQMHHHRAEHWIVVSGTARVTCGDKEFLLGENQSTYIPLGHSHRLENPGLLPLELIEVQSGSYLGEDDIVRFDDVYGRHQSAPPAPVEVPLPIPEQNVAAMAA